MEGLPEDSVAQILRLTSPQDVCSLASVSKALRRAAASDSVWEAFLPEDYSELLQMIAPETTPLPAVDCYRILSKGVRISDGRQHLKLDPATKTIQYSVSQDSFSITWGDDTRYWEKRRVANDGFSAFDRVAHLLRVCWFDVNAVLQLRLTKGTYSVYWRVTRAPNSLNAPPEPLRPYTRDDRFHWSCGHVHSSISLSHGSPPPVECQFPMSQATLAQFPRWTHLKAGEIVVADSSRVSELHARLYEVESQSWKSGLFVDGIVLEKVA